MNQSWNKAWRRGRDPIHCISFYVDNSRGIGLKTLYEGLIQESMAEEDHFSSFLVSLCWKMVKEVDK